MKRWRLFVGIGILIIIVVGSLSMFFSYFKINQIRKSKEEINQQEILKDKVNQIKQIEENTVESEAITEAEQEIEDINEVNIAIFGMDEEGYRTDVIFVVNLNEDQIKITSVPRDTYVLWCEDYKQYARANGWVIEESKINEMLAFGGKEHIEDLTIKEVERLLDIKIDHYVVITLDSFKEAVDTIGGIEVDIPDNIPEFAPGKQVVNGIQAEYLVRNRQYADADLGRIRMQHIFLQSTLKTIRKPSNWIKIPKLITVFSKKIQTDLKLEDLLDYYKYLENIDENQISFATLPGEARYKDGKSYFFTQ